PWMQPARDSWRPAVQPERGGIGCGHGAARQAAGAKPVLQCDGQAAIMLGLFFLLQEEGFRPMANSAQARKRARQAVATNKHNASLRSMLRTSVKQVRKAIELGDKAAATQKLQASQAVIDRIADKRIVHKNLASRTKSRLAQAIKAMA